MQGPVQEDIPITVRIDTSRIKKVKSGIVRLGPDDCMLVSDPAEYFYEDLATLFIDLKPRDEEVGQNHVDSVTVVEPLGNIIGLGRYAHKPDNSCKKTPRKSLKSFDARTGARKKTGIISEKESAGLDGIVVGRGVRKSKGYG